MAKKCLFLACLFAAAPVHAASLQRVNDWGATGVPGTASMYIYVPDELADSPPILVVAHYCGGTASAVFGQAQNGGIVAAADQYGFIVVVPQTSNNCWDVGSTAALTHDGGGDTHAIAQMVRYTITTHQANAERVYVTGDSSGAMMTQALLAVYPDIFKGGSEFAGVPAGCWAVGNPDGSWSSQCAGGMVTHTAEEWGDIARDMYPEYMGHRPRVQLFHGDGDTTIRFANHTEAIKQWTNVLGLGATPTSTDTVTLGSHQARRERWENACGYVVLDAFTSMGGDHGPSDAIFDASFVIPFLGLDSTADTDPEIAECGNGGMGGAGGSGMVAGAAGSAGAAMAGATSTGGVSGGGGVTAGGAAGTGGSSMGGTVAMAGMPGTAGSAASGGNAATGGTAGAGGSLQSGGAPATGGTAGQSASGGAGASVTGGVGGSSASAGTGAGTSNDAGTDGGCGCRTSSEKSSHGALLAIALAVVLARRRRRLRAF